jgi:hypothetical protein
MMTALTRADVIAALGSVDDLVVAEIIAMGATAEELAEAQAWAAAEEALLNEGRPFPTGRVGQLVGILDKIEEEAEPLLARGG